ncbi:hypothetical protein BWK62_15200 [Flavobacterium oreochromis]|uniref:SH3b domain-containing protein n=2 Tax=Flavobacterium TaxID=237 RepID=A0A246G712_9FLAO|nr:hypothetical protein BWK62_15200 [Flavobacterium oreochromis]
MDQQDMLITDIDLNKSLFKKEDIDLKKYKYNDIFIENIKINDLLNDDYRKSFFRYLENKKDEDDFKSTLFTQLLMTRIQQIEDKKAFFLLSELSKNPSISYDGIELLSDKLVELYLKNTLFFIKESTKNNDSNFIIYLTNKLVEFLVNENTIQNNTGFCNYKRGMLLLERKFEDEITDLNLLNTLKQLPKISIHYSPSLYSDWESKEIIYTNIQSLFNETLLTNLNFKEKENFKSNIFPVIENYFIKNYHINDPDGFVNVRELPNSNSKILGKVQNNEYVCFIRREGDWIEVYCEKIGSGFIHESRLIEK